MGLNMCNTQIFNLCHVHVVILDITENLPITVTSETLMREIDRSRKPIFKSLVILTHKHKCHPNTHEAQSSYYLVHLPFPFQT